LWIDNVPGVGYALRLVGDTTFVVPPGRSKVSDVHVTKAVVGAALVATALQACSADTSQGGPGTDSASGGSGAGCTAERCNGLDDDCDGQIDEDDPEIDAACVGDTPEACGPGTLSCVEGELRCAAAAAPVEGCNGIDDDCDGLVDEQFPTEGQDCIAGGIGACNVGAQTCVDGDIVCVDSGPVDETCNGHDDDCDGEVDEGQDLCKKVVFVTSQTYTPNFGGLSGGDTLCQAHAELGGLDGVFNAWLSSSTLAARDRLSQLGKPYVLVDDTVIAYDWDDLVDGTIQHPLNLTEVGGPPPEWIPRYAHAWTGTFWTGESDPVPPNYPNPPAYFCLDWTTDNPMIGNTGGTGDTESTRGTWTFGTGTWGCGQTHALYCFEQ
jgi:hypothetical protein